MCVVYTCYESAMMMQHEHQPSPPGIDLPENIGPYCHSNGRNQLSKLLLGSVRGVSSGNQPCNVENDSDGSSTILTPTVFMCVEILYCNQTSIVVTQICV